MKTFLSKYSSLLSILLIPIIFFVAWLFPSMGMVLVITSLSFGLILNSLMIVKKHRKAFLQGKLSRIIFVRNVSLEILGVVLVMCLAGFLGRFIADIATRHITNDLTKLFAGITIAFLIGMVVVALIKRGWNMLQKVVSKINTYKPSQAFRD